MRTYRFVTDCTHADCGDDINEMSRTATGVEMSTFARAIGTAQWKWIRDLLGYDRYLPISKDWHVRYYKGIYRGVPAYFLRHSRIEWIFTLDGRQGPSLCAQEAPRARENPGDDRRTPAILRHCVAKVAPKRGVSGAYAICTASLQRAGAMRGGKLTAAGRARDARHRRRTPENRAKDAAFERALAVRDNPSPKGQPTPLNLDVLARAFGVLDRIPNRLDPTDAPHLGRCLRAGLIALDGPGHLVLTPAGTEARRRRLAAQPHLMGSANQPRPNPGDGRRRSYAPDYSAPAEGMWVRDPGPAWAQHHRALVAAALRSWSGSPAEMKLHLDDVVAGAPVPGSGSGKMMRAQAEALAWELAHGTKRAPRALYRGSHIEPRGVQSWTTRKNVAERWAARNGGKVWTLPAGTLGLRRMDYASTAFDEEAEWLVDSR